MVHYLFGRGFGFSGPDVQLLVFIATIFFTVWYVAIIFKWLHCPHCRHMESLIDLTYAMKHPYYCRNCGQKIVIEDGKKRDM